MIWNGKKWISDPLIDDANQRNDVVIPISPVNQHTYILNLEQRRKVAARLARGDESIQIIAQRFEISIEAVKECALDALEILREINAKLRAREDHRRTLDHLERPRVQNEEGDKQRVRRLMAMAFSTSKIARMTNLGLARVAEIVAEAEREVEEVTPDQQGSTRNHVRRIMTTVADRAIQQGTGKTATAMKSLKVAIEAGRTLAKLDGANAPEQHESRNLNVTVSADATKAVLADPEMRRLKLEMENRAIEMEAEHSNG